MRPVAALLLLLAASSCAAVRSATRGISNSDQTGETAPELERGTWVLPPATEPPSEANPGWRLYVIFNPW
ncbi:MAG: hypothetical protein AAF726_11405 [Planctomycetota bacterium]